MKGRQIMSIEKKYFGKTQGGEDVYNYTITAGDISVTLSEFGGAIVKLFTPDRNGKMTDIVCGYDALSDYENGDGYQGALIGRFGNRIGKGKFTLTDKIKDGKVYVSDEITPDIWRVRDPEGNIPNQIDCAKIILEKISK